MYFKFKVSYTWCPWYGLGLFWRTHEFIMAKECQDSVTAKEEITKILTSNSKHPENWTIEYLGAE